MHQECAPDTVLFFSGCNGCVACCGDKFPLAPLVLDDFRPVHRRFPILFSLQDDELRVFMKLSDYGVPCPYLRSGSCSIYEERPPACRIYPLTPFNDRLLVDRACPAVGETGLPLVTRGKPGPAFAHPRLENFRGKRASTARWLAGLDRTFAPAETVAGIPLFRYAGALDDPYLQMHRASLDSNTGSPA